MAKTVKNLKGNIIKTTMSSKAKKLTGLSGSIKKTTLSSSAKKLSLTANVTKANYDKLKNKTITDVKAKAKIDTRMYG